MDRDEGCCTPGEASNGNDMLQPTAPCSLASGQDCCEPGVRELCDEDCLKAIAAIECRESCGSADSNKGRLTTAPCVYICLNRATHSIQISVLTSPPSRTASTMATMRRAMLVGNTFVLLSRSMRLFSRKPAASAVASLGPARSDVVPGNSVLSRGNALQTLNPAMIQSSVETATERVLISVVQR